MKVDKRSLADIILKSHKGKFNSNKNLEQFAKAFYGNSYISSIESLDEDLLFQIMQKAFDFFFQRSKSNTPKIEVLEGKKSGISSVTVNIINDDMPFLVDSVTAELARQGYEIQQMIHPVLRVERDSKGKFKAYSPKGKDESLMSLQISSLKAGKTAAQLKKDLEQVLHTVKISVDDWQMMLKSCNDVIENLKTCAPKTASVDESLHFLEWLSDNHFTFLGFKEYDVKNGKPSEVKKTALGILRPDILKHNDEIHPQEVEFFAKSKDELEILKSEHKALVHRNVYMDQVGIKKYNKAGKVIGEYWFLGLFASAVYYQTTHQIPIIRKKVQYVMDKSGYDTGGHSRKIIQFILDSYPRDEIFQSSNSQLLDNTLGILGLVERPRVGLFVREDRFSRFYSCLIFVPKERFDTDLRIKIQQILEGDLNGTVTEYYTQITDSPLSRLHVIVKANKGTLNKCNLADIQGKITQAASLWEDELKKQIYVSFDDKKAEELVTKYSSAFTQGYKTYYAPKEAIYDIEKIEESTQSHGMEVNFYETKNIGDGKFHVKTFNPTDQLYLSNVLPVLENFGLQVISEQPFFIKPLSKDRGRWVRDFRIEIEALDAPDISDVKDIFEEALIKVLEGEIENDGFNKLVLTAGFKWREVALIRGLSKYLKQAGVGLSQEFIQVALAKHPKLSRCIVNLFYASFDKKSDLSKRDLTDEIKYLLKRVSNLNEDIIIRRLTNLVQSILRTNYYQEGKDYISFKINSGNVTDLPLPRPHVEVFVCSPRMEGVHLRGGTVARGGLRWSDREEDFRIEVLGLMKAQMVKNSVIVPVGSKGGFVVKNPPSPEEGREAWLNEGIECYKTFLRGILDITDNIVNGKIVKPKNVVCLDDDDPYLVVAADKGTATFSDIANSVSEDYGFWLGDAFASGGSEGYDHKAMGITAKGAWVSVQRHFREMGLDVQTEDFTVAGIGDMAGDVFGNGMLLSKHIRLVAAFNHMHIFIDPNPDASSSYKERQRLFKKPRSSWLDYNKELISKGGGIFERSAKSIKITKQMQEALSIDEDKKTLTPSELIKAILVSKVDLLWNGGIGTYVKAENESDQQVGDKANDNLRINGKQLRCKVIGEGGNLGFTQLGRIEFSANGGRVNTDAIDNSAGVDCSDHEVNIKIALAAAVQSKKLSTKQRNDLLRKMTDDVADLVLRDNYLQTQAITIAEKQEVSVVESQSAFMEYLESIDQLNREIEFLPSEKEILTRMANGKGFTRPEIAVILSYSKINLYQEVLDSSLPDDKYFADDLLLYFPEQMQQKFVKEIENHRLRREIVATFITNSIVNRAGSTFIYNISRDTGMEACDIARAYTIARDAFGLRNIWLDIEKLDGKISADIQAKMFIDIGQFIERMTYWFLRNLPQPLNVKKVVADFSGSIKEIEACIPQIITNSLQDSQNKKILSLTGYGVPRSLASQIASLEVLASALDIALIAKSTKIPVKIVGEVYFELGARLSLGWLRVMAANVASENYWHRLSIRNLSDALFDEQRRLAGSVLEHCDKKSCSNSIEEWINNNKKEISRHDKFISEIHKNDSLDIAMLSAAVRRVESLCNVSI